MSLSCVSNPRSIVFSISEKSFLKYALHKYFGMAGADNSKPINAST